MAECQPLDNGSCYDDEEDAYEIVEDTSGAETQRKLRTWSFSSDEYQLHKETRTEPKKTYNHDTLVWDIPDSDTETDSIEHDLTGEMPMISAAISNRIQVQLPSDSEDEENFYDLVKSPTCSIRSAEPPLPPPLSSMPTRTHNKLLNSEPDKVLAREAWHRSLSASVPDNLHVGMVENENGMDERRALVHCNSSFSTALSDTDVYDEIDPDPKSNPADGDNGQSKPRFNIALQKGKSKSLDDKSDNNVHVDHMYAMIPRKPKWNFPSSGEDEPTGSEEDSNKRHVKLKKSERKITRQDSATSNEEERPVIPPKLWDGAFQAADEFENCEIAINMNRQNSDTSVTLQSEENSRDSIVMEYNPLYGTSDSHRGSLIGPEPEIDDYDIPGSITSFHSQKMGGTSRDSVSTHSHSSTGSGGDYEQSTACVDMDQLSLDSSGTMPKRIVETHETHEIIPSENNEDDIVERIIETQTITEKLHDNLPFADYHGEDYSKYLDNDDEFVSHIYTLGRTLEKGNVNKRKSKSLDFAFVENPFLPPSPVVETKPIEKKTVKQKITTLVKKRKVKEEDSIYAEVIPGAAVHGNLEQYDQEFTDGEYENEDVLAATNNHEIAKPLGNSSSSSANPQATRDSKNAESLLYETVDANKAGGKQKSSGKKKKTKMDKTRSLFSGIRKLLWRHKTESQDSNESSNSAVVIVEDDYQEFVP